MEDNDSERLIVLPMTLGIMVNEILAAKTGFIPRRRKFDILSFEYTLEELALVDSLVFENPVSGSLAGIEFLPNLKKLTIKSTGNGYYTSDRFIASITDRDGYCISKCKNLEYLDIENQSNLTYLDVSNLKKIHTIKLIRNIRLEVLDGLDSLDSLWSFDCVGNELLTQIKGLDKTIMRNKKLTDLNLDVLLFPDAIGFKQFVGVNKEAIEKIQTLGVSWQEILSSGKRISITNNQMFDMHRKACEALDRYVPRSCERQVAVMGIELFLAENVRYDYSALKPGNTHSHSVSDDPNIIDGKKIYVSSGPIGGANGAFNAFTFNTCVCEGYTRAMQYLLRLKGIKSHNVHCISGKDNIHMSTRVDDKYKIYVLPDDGYHSIICIDDLDFAYNDPCWNAELYQKGERSMPWTFLTKEEISEDHTLSFGERHIDNNGAKVSRDRVSNLMQCIENFRSSSQSNEEEQGMHL